VKYNIIAINSDFSKIFSVSDKIVVVPLRGFVMSGRRLKCDTTDEVKTD